MASADLRQTYFSPSVAASKSTLWLKLHPIAGSVEIRSKSISSTYPFDSANTLLCAPLKNISSPSARMNTSNEL